MLELDNLRTTVLTWYSSFGAVLEEFEVRDAMTALLAPKDQMSPDDYVEEGEMNFSFGNTSNGHSHSNGQVTT